MEDSRVVRIRERLGLANDAATLLVQLGIALGGATAVGAVLVNIASSLEPWAVILLAVSSFLVITGAIGWLVRIVRRRATPAYVALTEVIESGMRLAARVRAEAAPDASDDERKAWEVRFEDWHANARAVVQDVALHRYVAYTTDYMIVETAESRGAKDGVPDWAGYYVTELEMRIEQLRQIRAVP